jgi:hypothetical protein
MRRRLVYGRYADGTNQGVILGTATVHESEHAARQRSTAHGHLGVRLRAL